MPRMPLYSGPIASAVMPQSFRPADTGLFAQEGNDILSGATGKILRRVFMGPEADPNAALVRQRDAETALKADELAKSQRAESARGGLSGVMDELMYRTGRGGAGVGPTDRAAPVVDEQPYAGPVAFTGGDQPDETSLLRAAGGDALRKALGAGADAKQTTPIMQAFALANGDDNLITQVNSALEGKYLGDAQAPSMKAQIDKIEDDQRHELEKQDMVERTKKYGFDIQSADRRYDTEVDASTARRGQDVSAGTQRRGQDISAANTRRGQDMTDARARTDTEGYDTVQVTTLDKGAAAKPGKGKLFGVFGEETKATPGRTPSKTVRTTKVPRRAPAATAAPAAPGKKRLKYNPATGQLE